MKKAFLILQNGQVFEGTRFGAEGEISAELVFSTGMTGYIETLTDPSYHGLIVVQTFPLIGNYGIIPEDFESEAPKLSAYVVREPCGEPSNFRCEAKLDDYLKEMGVIGLCGVDTRALTKITREYGVMNAAVLDEVPENLEDYTKKLAAKALSSDVFAVTSKEPHVLNAGGKPHIVLWDFGYKGAMAKKLIDRGCKITVMPATSTPEEILAEKPDGILLSNGPGNPAVYSELIKSIRKVLEAKLPTFGICLGHQLLGIAKGAKTTKLKYGHRGSNQPVRDRRTGRLYITSQNHGYAIMPETIPESAVFSFENVNDGTCEGVHYTDTPAFSVQYHPEACGGPQDSEYLFDEFLSMIGGGANAAE